MLAAEIIAFMREPAMQQKFAELGAVAVGLGQREFAAYVTSETDRWRKVIEAANIWIE
jgi:tripartite-type tricarboxylate transporter receptor subunit TctC